MDLLSVPFKRGLETQLLNRNDVCSLKGGFIKGSQYTWLCQGPRLYLISTVDGSQVNLCTFASMPAPDPDVEVTTEVTCVVHLATRREGKIRHVVVGLNHNNQTGLVCIFDMHISRIVRAVHMPKPVTSLSVVDHGLGNWESRQVMQKTLRDMDGILAVGLSKGEVFLVDLRRSEYERAQPQGIFRDEFDACYLVPVTPGSTHLGNEDRLRTRAGDHICVLINSMYLREIGMVVDKAAQTSIEIINHNVSVSCLHAVPRILGLFVGYDEGFFQLWNMRNLKLEFSSYVKNKSMGSVSHVVFQEPNDDPHPVCYLWCTHEDETQHAAVLYSLVYNTWEYNDTYGYLYNGFASALELSTCNTALKLDTHARFLDCYCLERVKEAVRAHGNEEADLSLAVFVWEQQRGGSVTTHAYLFDMNEWLKEHRCLEEDRMQRSCVSFHVPAGALAVAIQPETLQHFATLQRLDKHLSPYALSFNWLAVLQYGIEKGRCEGAQKTLVTEILTRGPTCLVDSDLVVRCMKASLQPTIGCEEPPQEEVERRKFLLNLMLEYCYSSDVFLGSKENASDFRLLTSLHVWGWERAQTLKDNIDELSVRLFDLTGVRVDEMWHLQLRHSGTQLMTLYMLFNQLEKLAGDSLSNIWEHKEGIMLMHVYYVVLQWFVTKGLLPESADSVGAIPYPVVEIKKEYMSRRQELAAHGQTLFIDQFLERECEEEDLLRLGLINGAYPPHSVQCLVKMYLLSEIPLSIKNILTTYVLKDVVAHLDDNRRRCAVQELEDFSSKLQLTRSVVHLSEALWLFDHGLFQEGVAVLADNGLSPAEVMPWLHTKIVNMLVSEHQFSSALIFMKWNKMASKNKDDARLYLMVCLAERSFDTAFQFVHEFCFEKSWRDVLQYFFTSCERAGLLRKVMHQPLLGYQEEEFLNYLRRSCSPDAEDMRVLYFTMRGRVAEGLAENDRINQERLHKPRRRRLHCDDVPLRQLMAKIYCKVHPKDWRAEEDLNISLMVPTTGKTISDDTFHDKSSAGSIKRPPLSRKVRSTLHSLYVSSPGFPHMLTTQSTTSTPQGILKVRSYPSTRDVSLETLASSATTSNFNDLECDTHTPVKRIQFRISLDSSEKMEFDEGVHVQQEETEMVFVGSKEHREVASEKVAVIEDHTWSGLLAADEEEFDLDVVVPANTEEEIEDSVQNTTKDSSEPIDSIGDAAAASKESSSDESKTARARVVGPTSEQPSHAPWPVTDVTRFNRRGIGPRRPLPSASREAASKILVSSVTRETRTTESLLLMTKEVKLSSVSGKRRLDFETDDSPKQSCGIADGQRFDLNNFGNERLNPVTYENREHHGGGSGGSHAKNVRDIVSPLDTSGGSCNTDILSIDISNEIFSDGSYNARNVSQFDKTINSVEQSSFANDAHVEDFTKLERSTYSRRRSSIYSTPIKLFSNNEPSNIDKTAVVGEKFSEPRIEVSFQKELKEDSFALRGKNLGPTHDTTACDSEAEHSVAAVTQEYDSSMPAESLPQVSLVSENEIAPVGSIVISASQMESFSDKPKVGMGDMSSPREQDVRVQAFVEVNVSHRIEDSSLKNVSEPVKLTGNLSEVANESQIAVKEGGNKAAEDVSLLSTGVTELHPNENCAADKVSETLPNSTDLLKRKDQAQERTSKSNDVEEYSKGKEYDDSLSKLLNVEGRIADSMEVNISDVRQIELSQQKRIPFGLSSELLSKEFSNGLMHESVVQVTESSEETAVGQQTKCDSLPQVSFNVSHSTTAQENTVKSSEVAGTSSKDFAYTITGIKEVGTSNSGDKCDAIKLPAITHTSHYKESIEGQNEAAAEHKNGKSAKDMTTLKRFKVEEKSRELSSSSLIHGAVVQETEPIEKRTSVNLTSCGSSDISYDVMCSTLVKKHSIESSKITDASQSVLPESIGGAKEAVTLSFADKQDILNQSKKTDASSGVHKEPTVYSTEALVSDGVSLRCNSPEVVNIKSSSISLVRGAVMCERECTENISDDNQTSGGLSQMSPGVVHSKTIQESTGEFELAEATSRVLTEYVDNFKATVASSFGDKQDVIKLSRETDTPLTNREVDRNDNRKEAIGIENGKSVDYIRSLGNVQQDLSNSVSSFMLPGIETIAKGLGDSLEMPHEVIHGTLLQKHAVQASDITGTLPNVFSECIEGAKEVVVLNSASKQESTEKITNENCAASVSPSKMSLDVIHTTIDQKSTGEFRVAEASSRVLVECTDNVTESVVSSISDKQDGITQYIETDKCKTENGKLFKLVSQDSQCVEAQANNVHDVLVEDIQSERICADALHSVSKSDVVPSPTRNVLELRSRSLERSSNDNLTSTTVALENADRKNKSIPEDSASKIFEQGMSSCLEKEHLSLNFNTEKSVAGKDYESDGKAMNIDNSSMKKVDLAGRVVQEEVDQLPGAIQLPEASVSKTDGTEIKTSALPRSPDSLQMEDTSSRIDHEDKIEEGKEGSVLSVVQTEASETEKKKNLTNSDDFQLKDMVQNYSEKQYTRLGSVEKYEVTNIQKSNMDNIAIGNIKNHTASSNLSEELQTSDLPGCTAREMTTKLLKSVVSHSLVSGNVGNKIDTVDIVAVMSVDAIPIRETQGETIQSESGEACIASTVLIVDTKIKNRNPDNTEVVPSEIPTQYLPNSGEEELVTHSKVAGLSTLDHSELNDNTNENQISDVTLAEVHSRNIESGVSQHGAVLESQKIDAASAIYQETNDESEIPVITDVSCSAVSDILAETSETDVKETVDNLCSNMSVQDLQSGRFCVDTLHSADKADVLTVPSGDILKLRSRCVERSLDDADLLTKCKSESWELNTGMGKKRRSMSLLSLDIDVREVSTPPKRQRRVSLSCSGELRHDTPPLRRSLRLSSGVSGSEDDLSSTMSNPSTKLTSRGKRKGHVTKKHLQTVYEDMELMTEAARKKHAQDPYTDTSLSNPFMMPRRLTRSQLRMMKQNVRLEDMRSLGSKSPSYTFQMSAEDASDEDDGRPPSICGSEVSSMVSVSEDQSEGGQRSPRVRRRSYNLRSRTSLSPVSEVSHTQSTSSHDDRSSVVSGTSEFRQGDPEFGAAQKDDVKGSRQFHKTRSSRLSLPLSEELSSPTDSQQSQVTEDERKSKTRELRRSPRRPKTSESHEQTSTTSFSDAGLSPVAKDDEGSSSSSSDHHILLHHGLARQKKDKRSQARQVFSAANPTKKTKVSEEDSASSSRQSHPRPRYSRSAVHGRKSVRVRSSTSTTKDKGT